MRRTSRTASGRRPASGRSCCGNDHVALSARPDREAIPGWLAEHGLDTAVGSDMPDAYQDGDREYQGRLRIVMAGNVPASSWPGLSGPPMPARAATGGPDKPDHDDKGN